MLKVKVWKPKILNIKYQKPDFRAAKLVIPKTPRPYRAKS